MLIDQVTQAVTLFGLGMGTVFVLLSLLIACVSILSAACLKFEKNPIHAVPDLRTTNPVSSTQNAVQANVSEQERAIVVAAVQAHRQAKGI